jgi:hypothetical protein
MSLTTPTPASVSTNSWTPRVPLTAAERNVDFPLHNEHIVRRRLAVERNALPSAKRLAFAVSEFGLPTVAIQKELEGALYASLVRSVDFGYAQVRRELRGSRPTLRASVRIPGIGQRGRVVLAGLAGIHGLVQSRASLVAADVANTANAAFHQASLQPGTSKVTIGLAVGVAVTKTLHNDVLQLVGEALNLGRAAGAMSVPSPPEFAMRSEQLDERTCDECDALHGEIFQVGSAEFYDEMPPEGCAGGGRCRGIMVYGE